MSRVVTIAAASFICACLGAAMSEPVAAADFVLSCHGGGAMTFDVRSVGSKVRLEVVMVHAATTTPGPGQCTWLDRPVSAGEPTRLHIEEPGSVQVSCNAQGQCGVGLVPPDIRAITDAIRGGRRFLVHVHNNNSGYFEISKVGP